MDRHKEPLRPHVEIDAPGAEPPHAQDHWRVNLTEPWEVFFWSREFGCSENELKAAVRAAGDKAGTVRAYLASQGQQQRS
jgi:hypothetical protein